MTSLAAIIAFLLPFERVGSFGFGGINVRPSQIALAVGLIMAVRQIFTNGKICRAVFRRRETLALIAFLAWCAITLVNAENFGRSVIVLAFVAFTASQAIWLPLVLREAKDFARVRLAVLWSSAIVGLFGLWQFVGDMVGLPAVFTGLRSQYTKSILGFTRIESTALEPLYFADYLLLPIALAAAWLLANPERRTAKRLWALLALLFIDLVLTASRGGYAGAAVMLIVLAWLNRKHLPALRKLLAVGAVVVAALFVALRLLASFAVTTPGTLSDTFVKHVSTVTDGAAFVERLETFNLGLEAFRLHPFMGVGIGGYGPFVAPIAHLKPDAGWAIVNNEPIELLAETGLIGLALFLAFLFAAFRAGTQGSDTSDTTVDAIRIACIAALVGIIVQYQTFSTLYVMHVWFTIGLMLAAASRNKNS